MSLDLNALELSYRVNDKTFEKAFEQELVCILLVMQVNFFIVRGCFYSSVSRNSAMATFIDAMTFQEIVKAKNKSTVDGYIRNVEKESFSNQ